MSAWTPRHDRATTDTDWMDQAGCKRVPDLPWIEDPENVTVQQEACMTVVCLGCPVVAECRAYIGRHEITAGFWAGLHHTPDGPLIPFTGPGSRWDGEAA